jgi:hypothetical protein
LRCGHHPRLLSYEHRLRPDSDPSCRWCGEEPESVSHLLAECPRLAVLRADAGVATPRDLWSSPTESVDFLRAAGLL